MVDKLFGDFLVRYKEPEEPENKPADEEGDNLDLEVEEVPPPYEFVPIAEALRCTYVILYFTAEYMPPKCHEIVQPLTDLSVKSNEGSGTVKKFQVVVVNCDSKEAQYRACLQKLPADWYALPFGAEEATIRVEDMAQASNLPKITIVHPARSLEEPAIKDIKALLVKGSVDEALLEINSKLN